MFRKLKEKIVENSPQRLQFSQLVGENKLPNPPVPEDSFFSISEDDANTSSSNMESGYTSVPLVSPQENRFRRSSTSSMASDVSFLPRYESSTMYQLQSDLDISASEVEDNVSTSSQLGNLSKEQIYSAFQKSQMRYHKYRGRYTDLAKHYKDLERENSKMKSVLVETQDKAIRRVQELKEQCALEQKAKAHLEGALRDELDEKQLLIGSLQTKIKLLQSGNGKDSEDEDMLVNVNNENKNITAQKNAEDLENLKKYLTDARQEIEKLNEKLQEVKANNIVLNSKEQDYKTKIVKLEKEIAEFSEREKENNLKLAQSKMELHNELISKDAELNNLKRDNELLKQNIDALETNNMKNLQAQNKKLIEKIENLNEKYSKYDSELLKMEQYKIEIRNLHDTISELKRKNEELAKQAASEDNKKILDQVAEVQLLQDTLNNLNENNNKLVTELSNQKEECERQMNQIREEAKKGLISLEGKIREKLTQEFTAKEEELKTTFQQKVDDLISNEGDSKELQLKLMESSQLIKQLQAEVDQLENVVKAEENKYKDLEMNHLELINEGSGLRRQLTELEKEVETLKHGLNERDDKIKKLEQHSLSLQEELSSCKQLYEVLQKEHQSLQEERLGLIEDNASLKEKLRLADQKLECIDLENNENQLLSLKLKAVEEEKQKLLEDLQYQVKCFDAFVEENTRLKLFESNTVGLEKDFTECKEKLLKFEELAEKRDAENVRLDRERLEFLNKIKELEEQITIYKQKEDTWSIANSECHLLQMKLQKVEEEKQSLLDAFESEKSFYVSEKQKYEEEIASYKASLRDTEKLYSEQKEELEKIETELKKIHEDKEKIKKDLEERINQIQVEKDGLKKENENLMIVLEETKGKLSEYQNNSTDQQKNYEMKIDTLLKENRKAKAIVKKDKEHIEVLNKDLEHKIEEIKKVTAERSEVQYLCEKHEKRLKELESLLVTKETESTAQMKKEKEYQNELIHKLQEFERTISQKDDAFSNLERKLEEFEKRFSSEKEHLEQQIQDLKGIESLYSNITEENSKLKEEIFRLRKLEDYIEELEKQKADHLSKLQSLEDNVTHLENNIQKYEEELDKLRDMETNYNKLNQEKRTIEQELSNIKLIDDEKFVKIKLIEEAKQKLESDVSNIMNDYKDMVKKNEELSKQMSNYSTLENNLRIASGKEEDLTNKLSDLQKEISEKSAIINENRHIQENEMKKLNFENEELKENCLKLSEEITQLKLNNNHISSDNRHIAEENSSLLQELEATKLKIGMLEESSNEIITSKNELLLRNEELEKKYLEVISELEALRSSSFKEEKPDNSNQNSDELLKIQQNFYEMKETCDNLFLENKNLKLDLSKLEVRCDNFDKTKKQYELQISELEKQYSDLMHENQLLQDEIQELKISPINLQNANNRNEKLDNLQIIKQEKALNDANESNEKYMQEIEALREKVTKYKSLDLTNKSSIEFYENELQKLKNKNEKLNQKLDETLVTLNHCTELSHSTEIEYLRNVLYNYMLGKESLVLARVIAAVCKFDPQQTENVLQKEQQKQTLLGQLGIL